LSASLGISFQVGASSLSDVLGNPQNEKAHQMSMVLPDTNPAFVGLPYLLRKQSIQLERLALRREVSWFWLGHESTCNCQQLVEQ
jgi:hypothetical protein